MVARIGTRRSRSSAIAATALAALTWLACSSQSADGEACDSGADCESGRCVNGACAGSDCTCEGADCRGRSSCREGWLCTRAGASSTDLIPQCRQACTGVGSCPSDKSCENGVCREGAEPFGLAWVNIPRAVPCAARVPCTYTVHATEGVTIDSYTWSFGDAPAVETKEPTTTFTYDNAGTYAVLVRALASSGATSDLRTTEVLCIGGVGDPCDTSGSLCCQGTCTRGICL